MKKPQKRYKVVAINGNDTGTVSLREARELVKLFSPGAKIVDQFGNIYN